MASVIQTATLQPSVLFLSSKPGNARFDSCPQTFNPDGSHRGKFFFTSCHLRLKPKTSGGANTDAESFTSPAPYQYGESMPQSALVGSTRAVTTLILLAYTFVRKLAKRSCLTIPRPDNQLVGVIRCSVGPAFFASLRDRPSGNLNTPLTVVAAGLSKWLDIYSGVLLVRVLLSWFPNIPWERQPLSAIRDLCDPYLNLFRNIIPPVFDTLDVSPLFAFAVLGAFGSILNTVV